MSESDSPAPGTREAILLDARHIMQDERLPMYGPPYQFLEKFAGLISPILGVEVTPHQGALILAALKVARAVVAPVHRDSYVDGANYLTMAYEAAMVDGGHLERPEGPPKHQNVEKLPPLDKLEKLPPLRFWDEKNQQYFYYDWGKLPEREECLIPEDFKDTDCLPPSMALTLILKRLHRRTMGGE